MLEEKASGAKVCRFGEHGGVCVCVCVCMCVWGALPWVCVDVSVCIPCMQPLTCFKWNSLVRFTK